MCKLKAYAFGLQVLAGSALFIFGALFFGCAPTAVIGGPVDPAKLVDGTYEGSDRGGPNKAVVEVTIKDRSIVHIKIIQHQAWRGVKAEEPVVKRIIAQQSTRVDAVSGATNSSHVIMNAVQRAIEKAYAD
ncbi:MAG: FMN-binding protein [Desulfobacterales bacterium]